MCFQRDCHDIVFFDSVPEGIQLTAPVTNTRRIAIGLHLLPFSQDVFICGKWCKITNFKEADNAEAHVEARLFFLPMPSRARKPDARLFIVSIHSPTSPSISMISFSIFRMSASISSRGLGGWY